MLSLEDLYVITPFVLALLYSTDQLLHTKQYIINENKHIKENEITLVKPSLI